MEKIRSRSTNDVFFYVLQISALVVIIGQSYNPIITTRSISPVSIVRVDIYIYLYFLQSIYISILYIIYTDQSPKGVMRIKTFLYPYRNLHIVDIFFFFHFFSLDFRSAYMALFSLQYFNCSSLTQVYIMAVRSVCLN